MMSCNTRYLTNTPLIKATLACSTLDDYSFLMGNDATLAYGAGVIDAEKVRQCVYSTNFVNGSMPATLFTSKYHQLNLTAGLTYRIALVYEKPITSTEHFFLPTLGLTISNDSGEGFEYCTGMYQNIKIIEFTAIEGLTYEALIMRYADTGTEDTVGTIAPYSLVWCAQ